MKVEFSTAEFESSHGRQPRGKGGWMFEITGPIPKQGVYSSTAAKALGICADFEIDKVIRVYPGTLTEAKAEVRAGLKERVKLGIVKSGTYLVTVLP